MPHNESDSSCREVNVTSQYDECEGTHSVEDIDETNSERLPAKTTPPQDPLQTLKQYFPLNTCNLNEVDFQSSTKKPMS